MYFLYNFLFILILILSSPFWIYKILTKEKHRKGFFQKLGILPQDIRKKIPGEVRLHVHAVSVGEVIAATPFIKEFKKRHPEIKLIVSTVTPTGNDLARKRFPEADYILYSPYDLPWIVKGFINNVSPDLYITVETELWPNFLRWVKRSGAKSMIINGRISPRTLKGYGMIRPFMRRVLAHVDLFCMQSDEDARRIREIGAPAEAIRVTGNMKYDQRFVDVSEGETIEKRGVFGINRDDRVIIAGSTHKGEEELIIESYKECHTSPPLPWGEGKSRSISSLPPPSMGGGEGEGEDSLPFKGRDRVGMGSFSGETHTSLRLTKEDENNPPIPPLEKGGKGGFERFSDEKVRLIIVPRHVERADEIERVVRMRGFEAVKRTELTQPSHSPFTIHHSPPVILIDTIGELATLYSMATVVIIGGSFIPHGGQNPLEAMYYKRPVIFGPHMFNFREITEEILNTGAGVRVEKGEDLPVILRDLLRDTMRQREMGEKGYQIIQKNRGAVERNIAIVEEFLPRG